MASSQAKPFPGRNQIRAPQASDWLADAASLGAAFLIIFILLQGWASPLTGWSVDASASAILRNGFLPSYVLILYLLVGQSASTARALIRSPLLILLVALCFVSAFWSIDADATLRRSVALLFTSLAGVVISARWGWRTVAELLAGNFALIALGSLAVGILLPQYGRMDELFPGSWRGLYLEKNALGGIMSLGVSVCGAAAILRPDRRTLWLCSAVLCLVLVLLSTSKTSLVSTVLGVASIIGIWLVRRGPATAVVVTWFATLLVGAIAAVLIVAPGLVFETLGKDATFTGRTEIWTAAIRQVQTQPWTGFGYGVLWDHRAPYDPASWIASHAGFVAGHAHNGWLEVWLALGYIGLAIWTLYFLEIFFRSLAAAYQHPGAYLALPVVVMIALRSITEVSVLDYHDGEWTLFVIVATSLMLGAQDVGSQTGAGQRDRFLGGRRWSGVRRSYLAHGSHRRSAS